jgi:hypothetical protein
MADADAVECFYGAGNRKVSHCPERAVGVGVGVVSSRSPECLLVRCFAPPIRAPLSSAFVLTKAIVCPGLAFADCTLSIKSLNQTLLRSNNGEAPYHYQHQLTTAATWTGP